MQQETHQAIKEHDKQHFLKVLDTFEQRVREHALMEHALPDSEWNTIEQRYVTVKKFLHTLIEAVHR